MERKEANDAVSWKHGSKTLERKETNDAVSWKHGSKTPVSDTRIPDRQLWHNSLIIYLFIYFLSFMCWYFLPSLSLMEVKFSVPVYIYFPTCWLSQSRMQACSLVKCIQRQQSSSG